MNPIQVTPTSNNGKIDGPIYALAVDLSLAGATLQLGTNGKAFPVFGRDVYIAPAAGWDQVICTGTMTVQVYSAPLKSGNEYPGPKSPSGLGALDAAGNEIVVGPDADGAAPVGNPLRVAGSTGGPVLKTLRVDGNGQLQMRLVTSAGVDPLNGNGAAAPTASVQVGGTDGVNLRALLLGAGGQVNADTPYRATYRVAILISPTAGSGAVVASVLTSPTKRIRARLLKLMWPGKQTAGARQLLRLSRVAGAIAVGTGQDQSANIAKLHSADAAPSAKLFVPNGAGTPTNGAISPLDLVGPTSVAGIPVWIPAADAAFNPYTLGEWPVGTDARKSLVVEAGDGIGFDSLGFGAGYDGNMQILVEFTEE